MTELLELVLPTAGIHTRRAVSNIRNADYRVFNNDGIPDHRLACSRIACWLINDMNNTNLTISDELNDRHIANDRSYSLDDRREAQKRIANRLQLSNEIARLNEADFRALVDRLAGIDSTTKAA